jgi:hypothetical protein
MESTPSHHPDEQHAYCKGIFVVTVWPRVDTTQAGICKRGINTQVPEKTPFGFNLVVFPMPRCRFLKSFHNAREDQPNDALCPAPALEESARRRRKRRKGITP